MRPNPSSRTIWPFDFMGDIFGNACDHPASRAQRSVLAVLTVGILLTFAQSATAQIATFTGVQGRQHVEPKPQVVGATASPTSITFNPAAVAIPVASAQTLQASFAVSGYTGSFTPTATLHYGLSYTLGAVNCTGGSSSETCTVNITFQPTLPGGRRDALFLTNGTTRLATVLIYGIGQAPFALVQPGVITNPITAGTNYLYTSTVDENGTAYVLETEANAVVSVTKAGVVATLPVTGLNSPRALGINGAGVLYIADQTYNGPTITYDTVQGIQGTIPFPASSIYVQSLAVGDTGNIYENDSSGIYTVTPSGTTSYTAFNPVLNPGPTTIATDSQDNVFLGGAAMYEIAVGATAQTIIAPTGSIEGLGVDAAGTLYASRYSSSSSDSVAELPASNYATPIAMLDPSASPLGSSVGPDGTVWVGNYTNLDKVDRSQGLIAFGNVSAVTTQNIGIYNGGNQPLTISNIGITGAGFTMSAAATNNCTGGIVIPIGAFCQITVTLTAPHAGFYTGTLTFTDNSLNNTSASQTVALSGASQGIYVTPSPASLNFGTQTIGTTSAVQTVTFTNNGDGYSAGISLPTGTGPFNVTQGTCVSPLVPLAVGASCQMNVFFSPTTTTAYTNTSIGFGATWPGPAQTVTFTVSGTGTAATAPVAALTPNPVTFPVTAVNQLNQATATLTNSGNATLTGINIAITGTNATAFSIYPTSTCGTTLAAGANCSIILHFYPTTAGSFTGTLSVTDSATGSPQTATLSGFAYAQTAQTQFTPAELNAIAGTGSAPTNCANLAEPGPALQTQLCNPTAVAVDPTGNIYIVEQQDNVVKKLDTHGNVTTFAGIENTGPGSFSGDNGPANAANLSSPLDVAVDPYGNVYISDYGNGRIREVNATTGIITTFVGGASGQYFNGGTGTGVTLSPAGIAFDPSGNLYIAEPNQQIVVKVTPAGAASLFAGVQTAGGPGTAGYNGDNIQATTAELNFPTSVVADRNGNIYIADSQNYRVRYINENFEPGMISTAAGNGTKGDTGDGGSSISAEINPLSITINEAYELFISDGSTIRKVNGQGTINTFAGGGTGGLGGLATSALLQGVGKPGIDNNGNLIIPVSTTPEVLSAGPTGILQFGNQAVGTLSAPLTVTIENTGSTYLNDFSQTPLTATGPFKITGGTCGQGTDGGYSPGEGCTIIVTFTPTATGAQAGSISVPSNAPNSPQSIVLQGTGTAVATPQATLAPSGLSFPNTTVGSTTAVQTLTLSNPGNASLTISGITITGTNIADFAQTNTCTGTLAAGATCAINVTFTPASAASFSASISVADSAIGSPQTATLTGTGTVAPVPQAVLTPSSLSFPNTTTESTSAAQTLTLSNPGNAALAISGISLTGTNTADFAQTNTCTGTLTAGGTCTINVTFIPASATSFSAAVSVADNATGSPQTAVLTGTGVAPPPPADFSTSSSTPPQTVAPGGTAQFSVAVQPTNGSFTGVVTLSATGLPPGATASFQPATVTPGSSGATSTLTIQTATQQTSGVFPQRWPLLPPGITMALVAPLFWLRFRSSKVQPGKRLLLCGIVLALVGAGALFLTGCGGGFALPSKSTPTTYTITVTGTSGSDTHSTTVTLILQ